MSRSSHPKPPTLPGNGRENRIMIRIGALLSAALFLAILQDGVASGEFRAMDTRIVMLGMIGMCNYLFRWYRPDGRLEPHQIAGELIEMVMQGVRAGTPP